MAKWTLYSTESLNSSEDMVTWQVRYANRTMYNHYVMPKGKTWIKNYRSRKFGSSTTKDGKAWLEGTIKTRALSSKLDRWF